MKITDEQIEKLKTLYVEAQLDYEMLRNEVVAHAKSVEHTEELYHLLGRIECAKDAVDSAELHDRMITVLDKVFKILEIEIDEEEIEELKHQI